MSEEKKRKSTLIHSDFITPPIRPGMNFILVYMSPYDMARGKILDLDKVTGKKYSGLATQGLTYCVAIALIEKNTQGEIKKILLAHLGGDVGEKNLTSLFSQAKTAFSKVDEMLICPGSWSDPSGIERYHRDIDSFINILKKQSPELCPENIYYSDPSSSYCVTADGYSGSFPYDCLAVYRKTEMEIEDCLIEEQSAYNKFLMADPSDPSIYKFKKLHELLSEDIIALRTLLEQSDSNLQESENEHSEPEEEEENFKSNQEDFSSTLHEEDSESEEENFELSPEVISKNLSERRSAELYRSIRIYIYNTLFDPDRQDFNEKYKVIFALVNEIFSEKACSILEQLNKLIDVINSKRQELFNPLCSEPIKFKEIRVKDKKVNENTSFTGTTDRENIGRHVSIKDTALIRFKFDSTDKLPMASSPTTSNEISSNASMSSLCHSLTLTKTSE